MKDKKSGVWEDLRIDFMQHEKCPVSATVGIIGGKWKPIILYLISHDINRFGEMLKMIKGISKKMLTDQRFNPAPNHSCHAGMGFKARCSKGSQLKACPARSSK